MSEFLSEGESVNLLSSLNGMKGKIERNKFHLNRQTMVENKSKQFVFKVLDQLTISVWKTVDNFSGTVCGDSIIIFSFSISLTMT